jgi:hypothetical protein
MKLKIKRLIATVIDFIIIFFIIYSLSPTQILFNIKILKYIINILVLVLIIYLFPHKDCLIGYESIGKKIMGLGIYQNGERVQDKKVLVKRFMETVYLFPLYPLTILVLGKSYGDINLNTEVKEIKSKKSQSNK